MNRMMDGIPLRILVTGVTGQLGSDVFVQLLRRGYKAVGCGRRDMSIKSILPLDLQEDTEDLYYRADLTAEEEVRKMFEELRPDAVIHCAAWTAVDAAEDPQNKEAVFLTNVTASENLAQQCAQEHSKMLYVSTDYVFDGSGTRPWQAAEKSFSPVNAYGESKLQGEFAITRSLDRYFIVRTSWVFGRNGGNFVKTMKRLGAEGKKINVVCDQIGTPTYTQDLAALLCDMIETSKYGIYHATNEGGYISWYEFACEIFRQCGYTELPVPVTSEEYPAKARRPKNSRLDKSCLVQAGFSLLPDWKDALSRYLQEEKRAEELLNR